MTAIGVGAFGSCDDLTSVTIPDSVTTIGEDAFRGCDGLTSVTVGNSVTTIGYQAFYWCRNLASVTIGNSVTTIGDQAFAHCYDLTDLYFWGDAPTIGTYVFNQVSATVYYIPGTVGWGETYGGLPTSPWENEDMYSWTDNGDGTCTITGYTGPGDLTIPDALNGLTVTVIGNNAFEYENSLTSVIIPGSVTTIGDWAFYRCDGLTSVTIGNSVTTIGVEAFYNCYSLTSLTIGNSVTTIEDWAFSYCDGLTSVTIGNSVTTIGEDAFRGCYSLTGLYFRGDAPTLGVGVFYNVGATVYYIPGTVGWGATYGGLTTAEWPQSAADVDLDYDVTFYDFSVLGSQWGQTGCNSGNDWCQWADFDRSGNVDISDLFLLADDWCYGIAPW